MGKGKQLMRIEEIVDDVKARAERLYKEALFNVYCDCFYAKPFVESKQKIEEIFNQLSQSVLIHEQRLAFCVRLLLFAENHDRLRVNFGSLSACALR